MRKVNGEDITIKELKNCYFGYTEEVYFDKMVEVIECYPYRYAVTQEGDAIIRYPISLDDENETYVDYAKIHEEEQENLIVYDFINNWWGLDERDLEEFTFYFME